MAAKDAQTPTWNSSLSFEDFWRAFDAEGSALATQWCDKLYHHKHYSVTLGADNEEQLGLAMDISEAEEVEDTVRDDSWRKFGDVTQESCQNDGS